MTRLTSKNAPESSPKPLQPELLPLSGCHLIEASAGTGKTFNITRIYLRLLLERKLDVKHILVMTFTRAATEELRGRIAKEIRNALDNWKSWEAHGSNDTFFEALTCQFSYPEVYPALHNALLHLDEAAIFTIHGFCNRILSQQAFSSGVAFNVQMEADTTDIELEAVRDWYRTLTQDADRYATLTQNWLTPEDFCHAFRSVFSSTVAVQSSNPEQIAENFRQKKTDCMEHLQANEGFIFSALITGHKKEDERTEEWRVLIHWLNASNVEAMPKAASSVFDGRRFPRDADKKQCLTDLFDSTKQIKTDASTIKHQIKKALSYQLAAQGIEIIRHNIALAKKRSRVMNYDDLIHQLANSLAADTPLPDLIRKQFPVALVDEFQDTDPQQYDILKAIYQTKTGTEVQAALFMIGDPKQAIYAFRSGDVFTYLSARDDADYLWAMNTNWRSSTQMINAYNRLFYGAGLNESAQDVFGFNIQYLPVNPAGKADDTPLAGKHIASSPAALQLTYFPFNEDYAPKSSQKLEMNQDFCPIIAAWCSSEIHTLLTSQTKIGGVDLQEQDIAILVRDKREAAHMQDALRVAGYSSVYLSTHDNVFLSQEAEELELALYGILALEDDRALIAALSTHFMGCDTKQLASLQHDEDQWEIHRHRILDLRETWLKRGFMAMALKLLHQNFSPNPLHHERSLTNAIQLLELLQQASQRHSQPEQLLNWFREQIETQGLGSESELRLESDANLIRIITQHGCKGLEYPIVFIPFSTRYKDPAKFGSKNIDLYKYHERDNRKLNYFIGQDKTITELYKEEAWAESVRLLYVAMTRAEHRCYLCVAPFTNHYLSPLGKTLKLSETVDLYQSLELLIEPASKDCQQHSHLRSINEVSFPVNHVMKKLAENTFNVANFTGRIERNWWLSSFSALTRNLRQGGVSTPDRDLNEGNVITTPSTDIRFTLIKGAATGNFLHDIFEHADFSQPQWQRCMERPLMRFSETLDVEQQENLISWLTSCLNTPLGGIGNDTSIPSPKLSELNWSQTLRETEFYFPMHQVKPTALAMLLSEHRNQQDTNNSRGFSNVQLPGHQTLEGMMHGFIDLIFEWQGEYFVVDYKSSHLGNNLENYDNNALTENVRKNFYDLQYLLYSLALHRYLKSRIPDYHPDKHFGGVYYLYLRGMTPELGYGVYRTSIDSELLTALDTLFSGAPEKNSEVTCNV